MIEFIKDAAEEEMQKWEKQFVGKEMDLQKEITTLLERIINRCIFGRNLDSVEIPYIENGVTTKLSPACHIDAINKAII